MFWALLGPELHPPALASWRRGRLATAWMSPPPRPQLVKLCSGLIEAGKAYVTANRLFVSGVRDLSQQCQGDTVISVRGRLPLVRGGRGQAVP